MKKIATYLITGLVIANVVFAFSIAPVLAQDRYGFGYATTTGLGTVDLRAGIMSIVNVLLGFLGIIAIIVILWGGFRWMTAGGNEEKIDEAKKIITSGIIGLVIILISWTLVFFVVDQITTVTGGTGA